MQYGTVGQKKPSLVSIFISILRCRRRYYIYFQHVFFHLVYIVGQIWPSHAMIDLYFWVQHLFFQFAGAQSAPVEIGRSFVKKWHFFEVNVGGLEIFCQSLMVSVGGGEYEWEYGSGPDGCVGEGGEKREM